MRDWFKANLQPDKSLFGQGDLLEDKLDADGDIAVILNTKEEKTLFIRIFTTHGYRTGAVESANVPLWAFPETDGKNITISQEEEFVVGSKYPVLTLKEILKEKAPDININELFVKDTAFIVRTKQERDFILRAMEDADLGIKWQTGQGPTGWEPTLYSEGSVIYLRRPYTNNGSNLSLSFGGVSGITDSDNPVTTQYKVADLMKGTASSTKTHPTYTILKDKSYIVGSTEEYDWFIKLGESQGCLWDMARDYNPNITSRPSIYRESHSQYLEITTGRSDLNPSKIGLYGGSGFDNLEEYYDYPSDVYILVSDII
jgi:hypothetical protein